MHNGAPGGSAALPPRLHTAFYRAAKNPTPDTSLKYCPQVTTANTAKANCPFCVRVVVPEHVAIRGSALLVCFLILSTSSPKII